jgi:hypothetical protein
MRTKNGTATTGLGEQQETTRSGTVPSTLGEHSVPGGVMPKEGFEEHFEKVDS